MQVGTRQLQGFVRNLQRDPPLPLAGPHGHDRSVRVAASLSLLGLAEMIRPSESKMALNRDVATSDTSSL